MTSRSEPRCPLCAGPAAPRPANPAAPFCSPACKLVDLGRWLGGDYRIPAEEADPSAGEAQGAEGASGRGPGGREEP